MAASNLEKGMKGSATGAVSASSLQGSKRSDVWSSIQAMCVNKRLFLLEANEVTIGGISACIPSRDE
jgi:hypothetical protein